MEIVVAKERIGPSQYTVQYRLKPCLSRVPDGLSNRTGRHHGPCIETESDDLRTFNVDPSNNTVKSREEYFLSRNFKKDLVLGSPCEQV